VIRLARSESLRFRSRRLVKVFVVIGLVGVVIGVGFAVSQSSPPSEEQVARAEARRDRVVARCIKQGGFGEVPPGGDAEGFCESAIRIEDFLAEDYLKLQDLPEYMLAAAFIVILVGLVIGASMVGASWQTGTITTILAWEPRRLRWFLTRLVVTAAGVFVLAVLLLAFFGLAVLAGSALRGSTTVEAGWLAEAAGTAVRIAAVTAAVAAVGGAVAMIGRNTAAALGAVFVYMAVIESLVRGFRPALSRFMLGDNIASFVSGTPIELNTRVPMAVTPGRGGVVMLVYALVLTAVALVMLRTRDVN
jgi:ABC-2 type transport system permease protein